MSHVPGDASLRPKPESDPTSAPYWESVQRGVLSIQWCEVCNHHIHAPMSRCPRCHHADGLTWREVSGRGVIHSFVVVHNSRVPGFADRTPHIVAMVELDEQPHLFMFANLVDCSSDEIAVGDRVEVTFVDAIDGVTIPQFRLA